MYSNFSLVEEKCLVGKGLTALCIVQDQDQGQDQDDHQDQDYQDQDKDQDNFKDN